MKLYYLYFFLTLIPASIAFSAEQECPDPTFGIEGLSRTNEDWFRDYLQLARLKEWTSHDEARIRQKIMTTDIFTAVTIEKKPSQAGCVLTIKVDEKWTTIPVIRGAYGGGTPLAIIGGYETNAFGRLIAMAEN